MASKGTPQQNPTFIGVRPRRVTATGGWQKTWPILGAVYMAAGVAHFTAKEAFEAIYPPQAWPEEPLGVGLGMYRVLYRCCVCFEAFACLYFPFQPGGRCGPVKGNMLCLDVARFEACCQTEGSSQMGMSKARKCRLVHHVGFSVEES